MTLPGRAYKGVVRNRKVNLNSYWGHSECRSKWGGIAFINTATLRVPLPQGAWGFIGRHHVMRNLMQASIGAQASHRGLRCQESSAGCLLYLSPVRLPDHESCLNPLLPCLVLDCPLPSSSDIAQLPNVSMWWIRQNIAQDRHSRSYTLQAILPKAHSQ